LAGSGNVERIVDDLRPIQNADFLVITAELLADQVPVVHVDAIVSCWNEKIGSDKFESATDAAILFGLLTNLFDIKQDPLIRFHIRQIQFEQRLVAQQPTQVNQIEIVGES
jgi:hypothetical protein